MEYKEKTCLCNWMQMLRPQIGNVPLNRVLIPGAHDSNTYSIPKVKALSVFARCQEKSIYSQLCIGIRFFDLRVGDFASSELKEVIRKEMTQLENAQQKQKVRPSPQQSITSGKESPLKAGFRQMATLPAQTQEAPPVIKHSITVKPPIHFKQKMKIAKKFEKSFLVKSKQSKPKVDWNLNLSKMVDDYSHLTDTANESVALGKDRSRLGLWDDFQSQSIASIKTAQAQDKQLLAKPTKFSQLKNNFLLINKSSKKISKNIFANRRRPKKGKHVSKSVRIKSGSN